MGITLKAFQTFCTFFILDLNGHLCNNAHLHSPLNGFIGVDFSMKTMTDQGYNMLTYATFPVSLIIDSEDRSAKLVDTI